MKDHATGLNLNEKLESLGQNRKSLLFYIYMLDHYQQSKFESYCFDIDQVKNAKTFIKAGFKPEDILESILDLNMHDFGRIIDNKIRLNRSIADSLPSADELAAKFNLKKD